jgi:hypothetical protein
MRLVLDHNHACHRWEDQPAMSVCIAGQLTNAVIHRDLDLASG